MIAVRQQSEEYEFNARRWEELSLDSGLWQGTAKVETDRLGNVLMSPEATPAHNDVTGQIYKKLDELLPEGHTGFNVAISTAEGNKVPDVLWTTIEHMVREGDRKVFREAAVICVEVLSPSNTPAEIQQKKRLYFEKGAEEVWICDLDGKMRFFVEAGELGRSVRCPSFPVSFEAFPKVRAFRHRREQEVERQRQLGEGKKEIDRSPPPERTGKSPEKEDDPRPER